MVHASANASNQRLNYFDSLHLSDMPATRNLQPPYTLSTRVGCSSTYNNPLRLCCPFSSAPLVEPLNDHPYKQPRNRRRNKTRTPYGLFRSELYRKRDTNVETDMLELNQMAGKLWTMMSDDAKAPYKILAQEEAAWYEVAYPVCFAKTRHSQRRQERTQEISMPTQTETCVMMSPAFCEELAASWSYMPSPSPLLLPQSVLEKDWLSQEMESRDPPIVEQQQQLYAPRPVRPIMISDFEKAMSTL